MEFGNEGNNEEMIVAMLLVFYVFSEALQALESNYHPLEYFSLLYIIATRKASGFWLNGIEPRKKSNSILIFLRLLAFLLSKQNKYELLERVHGYFPSIVLCGIARQYFIYDLCRENILIVHYFRSISYIDSGIVSRIKTIMLNNPSGTEKQIFREYLQSLVSNKIHSDIVSELQRVMVDTIDK